MIGGRVGQKLKSIESSGRKYNKAGMELRREVQQPSRGWVCLHLNTQQHLSPDHTQANTSHTADTYC